MRCYKHLVVSISEHCSAHASLYTRVSDACHGTPDFPYRDISGIHNEDQTQDFVSEFLGWMCMTGERRQVCARDLPTLSSFLNNHLAVETWDILVCLADLTQVFPWGLVCVLLVSSGVANLISIHLVDKIRPRSWYGRYVLPRRSHRCDLAP